MSEQYPPAVAASATNIAVVGGGSIGVAFALVFARAGHPVSVFEPVSSRRGAIPAELHAKLESLHQAGLLDETPAVIAARVGLKDDLTSAVTGAALVQECVPERLEIKQS